jgi:hypothetical protein
MNKEDPLLAFSYCLMRTEFPNIPEDMASKLRLWIESFLTGTLSYNDNLKFTTQECGKAGFVERLQEIFSVPDESLPQPSPPGFVFGSRRTRIQTHNWTTPEDNRLLAGIRKFGVQSAWAAIAKFVGNSRSRSQYSQRWIRVLDPRICKSGWTCDEDKRLLELV